MQTKAKVLTAVLTLCLALAQGCDRVGDNRPGGAAVSPTPAANGPKVAATPSPAGGQPDACRLLTSEDIQAVQGEVVKEAKGSLQADGPLLVEQCLYATPSYNKSVSLTLTRRNAAGPAAGDPKDFWRERFGGEKEREKGEARKEANRPRGEHTSERRGEEKEEGERPPVPVKGIGDQAYWAGNDKTGVLYVLKGDRFLRVSIGGPEGQQAKIEKMKELARRALKRL
jgi:hypothetical protein